VTELLVLPDGIGAVTAAFIVLATMATSMVGAMFGVGGGTILLAVLAVLLPPVALIPVHGVVQLGATGVRAVLLARHINRATVLPFVAGSAIGSALSGVMFFQFFPPWLIQYAVAAFIAWSVLGAMPAIGRRHILFAGAFSGFLTILFGATGTFVSAFVKSMNMPPLRYVATHATLMSLQHLVKIVVFGVLGFAFGPYALLITLMLASGFVGTVIGRNILLSMSEKRFKPVLNAILLVLALRLAWQATEGLLAA